MTRVLYQWLVRLHPASFREQFGEEMLWIFDECAGKEVVLLLGDGVASLSRQWFIRSGVWRFGVGAIISGLLMLSVCYGVQDALEKALLRGNLRRFAETEHRLLVPSPSRHTSEAVSQEADKSPAPIDALRGIVSACKQRPVVIVGKDYWLRQARCMFAGQTQKRAIGK